ncbi:hypothetical protein M406DRAFT_81044 [Cryphonectria parasitica EP155]|uniref:Ubiquitin carboxyl-terminal hydrolase n=1 Tax=Cryphonectria parasitica (strain ATCC 38755 / EP155) TaxID=660469 RepID=A0A9P4Y1Q8_CRYP1|nr:uncharacterized protein M406DRAFT_81044 [Cryphonectria parasitica EP155]KAF3764830.1 hypothetical protein M406DRAFT_81044 [Cryphonectria parasitica EP155]
MPEKPLTVAAYAAGASLAAATLIYVFAPTYFLDNDPPGPSTPGASFLKGGSSRRKGVVGLVNPANDCFINSILQALAGLGDLRVYLIREMHRRSVGDWSAYTVTVPEDWKEDGEGARTAPVKKGLIAGQQRGLVTQGLKEMLDQLNERPIYKKTITAAPFVAVLEGAFKQNISRQQHDAQEFLQIVVERLCDEYHAGHRARKYAEWRANQERAGDDGDGNDNDDNEDAVKERLAALAVQNHDRNHETTKTTVVTPNNEEEEEDGFPMEGVTESQIECLSCGFKPRPSRSRFCTLTLSVPIGATSTTLNACFDGMFKTEHIDDYKCEKCRLVHAQEIFKAQLARSTSEEAKVHAQTSLEKLQHAIETDPESPPEDVPLPDSKHAPRRKIARHTRVTRFPKILAIHLSRSIYAGQALKNSAKVAFPERLPLGGLLLRRNYKLLGVVAHKGGHQSGHYESFRRQNVYPPYSNPTTFQPSGVYSKTASPQSTPQIQPTAQFSGDATPFTATPSMLSPARDRTATPSKEKDSDSNSIRSIAASAKSTLSKMSPSRHGSNSGSQNGTTGKPSARRRKVHDKWWRISDDKIKEASTRELLGMQREVYLLFYEIERDGL